LHRLIEPAQHREFIANTDSDKHLDAFPYLEHFQNIADLKSQPLPPRLPRTETYPSAGTPLSDYIAEPWERHAEGCFVMNLEKHPYYPFGTCEEYKYIHCRIEEKGMKTCYDTVLKEQNTALRFLSFKNCDRVQKLMASTPDDQNLRE